MMCMHVGMEGPMSVTSAAAAVSREVGFLGGRKPQGWVFGRSHKIVGRWHATIKGQRLKSKLVIKHFFSTSFYM